MKESLLFIADGITDLDEEVMKTYIGSDFQLRTIHYSRGRKSKVKEKYLEIIEDANKMVKRSNVNAGQDLCKNAGLELTQFIYTFPHFLTLFYLSGKNSFSYP